MRRGQDVMSFTYDAVGNRKTRADYNGAVTDYTYDALNRLKTITYPDTTTLAYTYDKFSSMQTATNVVCLRGRQSDNVQRSAWSNGLGVQQGGEASHDLGGRKSLLSLRR